MGGYETDPAGAAEGVRPPVRRAGAARVVRGESVSGPAFPASGTQGKAASSRFSSSGRGGLRAVPAAGSASRGVSIRPNTVIARPVADTTPVAPLDGFAPIDGIGEPDGVLARIGARLPEFTGALRRVADRVLADPVGAARATIVELAASSGTSPATITRFCRALGFDGYAQLRLGIAGETGRAARDAGWTVDIGRAIQPDDPLAHVLRQIMAADTRAMRDTAAQLDLTAIATAADAITNARRVDIYGTSGSALVGAELQFCLHRIGVAAWCWKDVHDGLTSAATLRPGDVAIGVSHTGQSQETIEVLAEAGSHGARTVAVTSVAHSPLADVADLVLLTAVQESPLRPDSLSARHPQMIVLDLLYIAVAQRLHDRAHNAFQVTARAVDAHRAAKEAPS